MVIAVWNRPWRGARAADNELGGPVKASKHTSRGRLSAARALIAGAIGMCAAASAFAALGDGATAAPQGATTAATVMRTAKASSASGASGAAATTNYSVNSMTLASGTVINQYLSSDGVVFGIAWKGPRVPDLATLLGSYFPQYQQGLLAQRTARGGRGPVSVQDSGLVVHSGGHMGAFSGVAYLPQSLPAGVSASDIQ
jgi:hypothetical protein